jgi:ParB family chromosome partitioning protein
MDKRPALGRGLNALIPEAPEAFAPSGEVDITLLVPNAFQPRAEVDDAQLEALAQSIKANGVIQPIVVRRTGDTYQIIAGERRWRAARKAGLSRVPIVIRTVAPGQDQSLLEMALVENIQRENLNPIEQGLAYRRLIDEFHLSQEAVAERVGKDRASIANYVRLLKLPSEVQAEVSAGTISMGHARAFLSLPDQSDQLRTARDVIARGLSVRDTETLVKRLLERGADSTAPSPAKPIDVHTRAAEDQLRLTLGTRVRIVRRGTRGRIEIEFVSEDELIRIYDQLTDRSRN